MVTQTTVTNSPVPESGDPAIGAGKSQKEMENRIRENLRAEYDRKSEELSERLSKVEEEKKELESRLSELNSAEKNRLTSLNNERSIVESQLLELETKPEFAGYREKISRETNRARDEAVSLSSHETSVILMKEFIEHKAEEEKISFDQLKKELNAILKVSGSDRIKYPDLMPHERSKAAYAERAREKELQALRDENKRLKGEKDGFSEEGTRVPRSSQTTKELREQAIAGDKEAGIALSKDLDARQKEYDSQIDKQ